MLVKWSLFSLRYIFYENFVSYQYFSFLISFHMHSYFRLCLKKGYSWISVHLWEVNMKLYWEGKLWGFGGSTRMCRVWKFRKFKIEYSRVCVCCVFFFLMTKSFSFFMLFYPYGLCFAFCFFSSFIIFVI